MGVDVRTSHEIAIDEHPELRELFDDLAGTLPAGHHQHDVDVGIARNGVLQHGLARAGAGRDNSDGFPTFGIDLL